MPISSAVCMFQPGSAYVGDTAGRTTSLALAPRPPASESGIQMRDANLPRHLDRLPALRHSNCGRVGTRSVLAATVVIAATMVVTLLTTMLIPPLVSAVASSLVLVAMHTLAVPRNILTVVPVILNKIDPLAAGVVLVAMPSPVLRVAARHAQVDRLVGNRCALDQDRLPIDDSRGRIVPDVEAAIEAGLADADRYTNVGGEDWGCCGKQDACEQDKFHDGIQFLVALLGVGILMIARMARLGGAHVGVCSLTHMSGNRASTSALQQT